MYNVSKYVQYENPYVDKINIRIGFEFPLREVKKPKDWVRGMFIRTEQLYWTTLTLIIKVMGPQTTLFQMTE